MRADAFFREAERLPFASLEEVTRGGGLVVVAPHPDDESLGCGGLIAAARKAGVDVRVVVVSDGVGSHPGSRRYPPAALRDLREAEALAAGTALGMRRRDVDFLRLPDTAVPSSGPAASAAAALIAARAKACAAAALCVTWHLDPHCDHAAAARIVALAKADLGDVRLFAYPVWGWTLPAETDVGAPPRGVRFDISDALPQKAAAIAAHRSQVTNLIEDDPNGFQLSAEMLARFARPYEILLDVDETSAS